MSIFGSILPAIGSFADTAVNWFNAEKNRDMQEQFAKEGLRWKVADAKAAGLHPLAALGAQTFPYSPAFGDDMGFSQLGQDISRAIDKGRTLPEKQQARMNELAIERGELENDLLRSQIAVINQPGAKSNAGLPYLTGEEQSSFVGNTGGSYFQEEPVIAKHTDPSMGLGVEAGAHPAISMIRNPDGSLTPYMSDAVKEKTEEDFWGRVNWNLLNRILPVLDVHSRTKKPSLSALPKGQGYKDWKYHWFFGWQPSKEANPDWNKNPWEKKGFYRYRLFNKVKD